MMPFVLLFLEWQFGLCTLVVFTMLQFELGSGDNEIWIDFCTYTLAVLHWRHLL